MLKIISAALLLGATGATAQSAIERHAWQERGTFDPYSRTASAITGPVTLSGNASFATPGSKMRMVFGNGASVGLTAVVAKVAVWDFDKPPKTGEVFSLIRDPGPLENGNTICRGPARFVAFSEAPGRLDVSFYSGKRPPRDVNDKTLCGTFSYYLP